MQRRLGELTRELQTMGLDPEFVEEDGGILASCGETLLHVQCLGAEQALPILGLWWYLRKRTRLEKRGA